jgi:hypothetical protein
VGLVAKADDALLAVTGESAISLSMTDDVIADCGANCARLRPFQGAMTKGLTYPATSRGRGSTEEPRRAPRITLHGKQEAHHSRTVATFLWVELSSRPPDSRWSYGFQGFVRVILLHGADTRKWTSN